MKRKWYLENIQINVSASINTEFINTKLNLASGKRSKAIGEELGAVRVSDEISMLLETILNDNNGMDDAAVENVWNNVKFIFFLGVQGKEAIHDIREKIPFCFNSFAFISSNISTENQQQGKCSQNDHCITLSSYFKVLDPLGGGIYPLDYLVIIDRQNYILRKVPIKINKFTSFVLKHGINIDDLDTLIDKYLKLSKNHQDS